MGDAYFSFDRIDPGYFCFDEVDAPIQHGVAQVKGNVLFIAFAESQSHQGWIENKITVPGNERNLVFIAQLLRQALGGYDTAEPTAKD